MGEIHIPGSCLAGITFATVILILSFSQRQKALLDVKLFEQKSFVFPQQKVIKMSIDGSFTCAIVRLTDIKPVQNQVCPPSISQQFVSKRRKGLVLLSAPLFSIYLLTVLRTETGRKQDITWNIERKNYFLDSTSEAPTQ